MKSKRMIQQLIRAIMALLMISAIATDASGQIKVLTDNSIGLGTTWTGNYKTHLVPDKRIGLFITHTYNAGSNDHLAAQFDLNSTGLGRKTGLRIDTYQEGMSNRETKGLQLRTFPDGSGSGFGIYNRTVSNALAEGTKYGIYNYHIADGFNGTHYGIFSQMRGNGTNASKVGIYSDLAAAGEGMRTGITNKTNQGGNGYSTRGIENFVTLSGDSGSGNAAWASGMYNYLYFNGASSTGHKAGIYNAMENEGTGNRHGIWNYTYQHSSSSDHASGLYNWTFLNGGGNAGYGIYNRVVTDPTTTSGNKYGIYNRLEANGTGIMYALYSQVYNSSDWAGYFVGNVHVTGTLTQGSDEKLKKDIQNCQDGLAEVVRLAPRTYKLIEDGSGGDHYGFVAQEVEAIFPSLVSTVHRPGEYITELVEVDGIESEQIVGQEPGFDYKAVNYIEIIPILTQAIKELDSYVIDLQQKNEKQGRLLLNQQHVNDAQEIAIKALLERIRALENQQRKTK